MSVGGLQCEVVWRTVSSDTLRYDLRAGKQCAVPKAHKVVAGRSPGSPVALDERMDPIEAPQYVRRQKSWVTQDVPILVDDRKQLVRQMGTSRKCGGI